MNTPDLPPGHVFREPRKRRIAWTSLLAAGFAAAVLSAWSDAAGTAGGSATVSRKAVRYWTAVARCETGGGGPPKWDWGSKHRPGEGSIFEGGLGFSSDTWHHWAEELGLLKRYPHAYDAPPRVQIMAAVYGMKTHHAHWGCAP
jgi:hypothetical protein